ncbi:MAG TPA: hypothetical protein VFL60_04150 [Gaiellaceae bacterium]|nr:hypothetical protein [Gaiellaceae bacterium]
MGRDDAPRLRLPPALAAHATTRVLELLGEPPQRVLELAFAGIHATPLRLAGFDVEVLDDDPRAVERAGAVVAAPSGRYDAVVAPAGADLAGIETERVVLVGGDGGVWLRP